MTLEFYQCLTSNSINTCALTTLSCSDQLLCSLQALHHHCATSQTTISCIVDIYFPVFRLFTTAITAPAIAIAIVVVVAAAVIVVVAIILSTSTHYYVRYRVPGGLLIICKVHEQYHSVIEQCVVMIVMIYKSL